MKTVVAGVCALLAGTTVKVMIDGKPEYHLFSHSYQTLDWSRSQADHWFSRDGTKWQHSGALLTPHPDEKTGMWCTYGHPTPFYVAGEKQWYMFYSTFRDSKVGWVPHNTEVYSARSRVRGPQGIYGPWNFPGEVVFTPGVSSPSSNMVAVSISCPFQVKDGRWAIYFCPSIGEGNPIPMQSITRLTQLSIRRLACGVQPGRQDVITIVTVEAGQLRGDKELQST